MKFRFLPFLCFLSAVVSVEAQAPFGVSDNLLDLSNQNTLGLSEPEGLETKVVFAPGAKTDHFSHGTVLAAFKGALYCMWQSSASTEDTDDTWVAYARSTDDGATWSEPACLASASSGYCSSGGWWVNGDTLVAYINVWAAKSTAKETDFMTSVDGLNWSGREPVKMADGTALTGIFEQDPHLLPNGRILSAAHLLPGLKLTPIYTDDPSGVRGWKQGVFPYEDNGSQSREMEPSFYLKPNTDTLVMVARDNKKIGGDVSYRKMASVSTDWGEHWTKACLTDVPDSKAKQSAGNLPDGTVFIASNPSGNKTRVPLAVLLSADGTLFDHACVLRTKDNLPAKRYTANTSTGYSYPKSMVSDGWLYVGYAVNKEDVAYTRVPLTSLYLRGGVALRGLSADEALQVAVNGRILRLSGLAAATAEVCILSPEGRCLLRSQVSSESPSLDLSSLSGGIYLLSVRSSAHLHTEKILLR